MLWKTDPHNSMDVVDSRDIIERFKELESEREDATPDAKLMQELIDLHNIGEQRTAEQQDRFEELNLEVWATKSGDKLLTDNWDEDQEDEYQALKSLIDEAGSSPDWSHGETLIRDDYFQDYAEQFADDIGAINKESRWPNNHIDWEAAAEDLKQDYFSVDWDGVEYWIRS